MTDTRCLKMTDGINGRVVVPFSPAELEQLRWHGAYSACLEKERESVSVCDISDSQGREFPVFHSGSRLDPDTGREIFSCEFCDTQSAADGDSFVSFSSVVPKEGNCLIAVFACQDHMVDAEMCIRAFRHKMDTEMDTEVSWDH